MGVKWPVNFSQCSMFVRLSGRPDPFVITLGIQDDGVDTVDEVAQSVYTCFQFPGQQRPFNGGSMNIGYSFERVVVARGPSSAPIIGEHIQTTNGQGTNGALPPNCAQLIKKNTALGGRHGRGRVYMPPCSVGETQVGADGIIGAAALASTQTDWNNLHAALIAVDLDPVLFHDSETLLPTPITSFSAQGLLATQRRRLR